MPLVLTRRLGESIIIGDTIKVTILGIKGNQARVLIDAPTSISVHREEIYKRVQEEREQAEIPIDGIRLKEAIKDFNTENGCKPIIIDGLEF